MIYKLFTFFCLVSCALAAPSWTIESISQTLMAAVDFPPGQTSTGFLCGATSNGGSNILKTTDGGNTWNEIPNDEKTQILYDLVMHSTTTGIASGVTVAASADQYTVDGNTFVMAKDTDFVETCQSAELLTDSRSYGLTGQWDQINGVSISHDGGVTYNRSDCKSVTSARYGAFPSATTWYVAAGEWPNNAKNSDFSFAKGRLSPERFSLSRYIHVPIVGTSEEGKPIFDTKPVLGVWDEEEVADGSWVANIMKTTDGGHTWTSMFLNNTFYFNQITCPTTDTCYAVGENDNFAFVYSTTDGGMHWHVKASLPATSLMACVSLSEFEIWIGGANTANGNGLAWRSVDGGNNWIQYTVPGVYFNYFDFQDSAHGWATGFDELQQSNLLRFA